MVSPSLCAFSKSAASGSPSRQGSMLTLAICKCRACRISSSEMCFGEKCRLPPLAVRMICLSPEGSSSTTGALVNRFGSRYSPSAEAPAFSTSACIRSAKESLPTQAQRQVLMPRRPRLIEALTASPPLPVRLSSAITPSICISPGSIGESSVSYAASPQQRMSYVIGISVLSGGRRCRSRRPFILNAYCFSAFFF